MSNELVIVKDEKYLLLVDEIRNTITETIYNSRWMLVEGHWLVGQLIRCNFGVGASITNQLQTLAVDAGVSERTLWYSLQFYDKYPKLDEVPLGKNISWTKLITKYLPKPKEEEVKSKPSYVELHEMIKQIKELLQTEWMKANQEGHTGIGEFIRYLQDQVEKITT